MKRRDFLIGMGSGLFSLTSAPHNLGRLTVRNFEKRVTPFSLPDEGARIAVVGIGPAGSQLAHQLSRSLRDVTCHCLTLDAASQSPLQLQSLLALLRSCDLVFISSFYDDPSCNPLFGLIAEAAGESGGVVVGVVPEGEQYTGLVPLVNSIWPVSHLALNEGLLGRELPQLQREAWDAYGMRHLISTVSELITQRGLICIDFADVRHILVSAKVGRLGVGVAGRDCAHVASFHALERLKLQGCSPTAASAVLACVYGSSLLTMDEFDAASLVLHESVHDDTSIIIGLIIDEMMGNNVRVTVMALG